MATGKAEKEALEKIATLTRREREIVTRVILGDSNQYMARTLYPKISVKTVETHRARINKKLKVSNAMQLIRLFVVADRIFVDHETGDVGIIDESAPVSGAAT